MDNFNPEIDQFAKLRVIGVGGGGGNAVTRMQEAGLRGVDFIIANTDAQALEISGVRHKIQIGHKTTGGLGAGANPTKGLQAAEESRHEIEQALEGSDMVFITAGMGGGTGTGAAPIIAEVAKELGALTVAIVTKPFQFEGKQRRLIAEEGAEVLKNNVDCIITIPNDKLLAIADQETTMVDAFRFADDVLRQAVQGVSELITIPSIINLDFADVKTVMTEAGSALIGIGEGAGEHRAVEAAEMAINCPLIESSIEGAQGIVLCIYGGPGLTLHETNAAAEIIRSVADENANIIFGAAVDEALGDRVRITVFATGFGEAARARIPDQTETKAEGPKSKEIHKISPQKQDDLDIPAFLRMQGNK